MAESLQSPVPTPHTSAEGGPRALTGSELEVPDQYRLVDRLPVPSVTVVIPARNAGATIGRQLEALARQSYSGAWEIIVADNASSDSTSVVAEAYGHGDLNLRVVDASHRLGVNAARNAGIRESQSELVLICDADDIVGEGWIQAMVDGLSNYDAVGGVLDVETLNSQHSLRIQGYPRLIDRLGVGMGFLPTAPGENCGFRRAIWEVLGGFDEDYVGGGDEVDFFWRLQLSGHSLGLAPEAWVHVQYPERTWPGLRRLYYRARSQPLRYRNFRSEGLPRSSLRKAIKRWTWLIIHVPDVLRQQRRVEWLRQFVKSVGLLVGSFKYRVWYV